jgi:hypothetical protein
MAFKALPTEGDSFNCEAEFIKSVCSDIEAACGKARSATAMEDFVENKDVIGLAEAKKSTGLLEQWGYSLRKLVWA